MKKFAFLILLIAHPAFASKVYFENLKDGATLKNPVIINMGVDGMKIRPAGQDANDKTTGHHHLIIDGGPIKAGDVIPTDAKHLHFGKGQTSTELNLPPGEHTLTLQFADGAHRSYGPGMATTVKIKVEGPEVKKMEDKSGY